MSLTPEQREIRRRAIGSTDAPAIVALYNPALAHLAKKKNASDVFLRLAHDIDIPFKSVMGRGLRVEPMLKKLYRETVGPVGEPPGTLRHPTHSWAVGSPDGLTATGLVEYKTASVWIQNRWGAPGTDEVPDDYNIQVQWLLEVSGRSVAHVLVAFGSDTVGDDGAPDFAITETAAYVVRKDEALVSTLLSCGERFWTEHVCARVAPGIPPVHNRRAFKRLTNDGSNPGSASDSSSSAVVGAEVGDSDGGC